MESEITPERVEVSSCRCGHRCAPFGQKDVVQ
jgi:hypothetical protein